MKIKNISFLKKLILPAAAFACIATAVIRPAWSYFTTYATAKGTVTLHLGDETEIREEFSSWSKRLSISNSDDSKPVWIRARAYCGSAYTLTYSDESGLWTPDADGFYYYQNPVPAGGVTENLVVHIDGEGLTETTDPASFNVVVVYESTPVLYHEDGSPYADWTSTVNTGTAD